jgi:hypothetical protein
MPALRRVMSVTKLGHNKFQIRIYDRRDPFTKKRVNQTVTFYGTEEQALRLEKRLKAKARAKKSPSPSRMKLNDLLDLYLEDAKSRVAPRTFFNLERELARWVRPTLGNVSLKSLNSKLLKSFFQYLAAPKQLTQKQKGK